MDNKLNYNKEYFINKYKSKSKENVKRKFDLKIGGSDSYNKFDYITNLKMLRQENRPENVPELKSHNNNNIYNIEASSTKTHNQLGNGRGKDSILIQNYAEKSTYCRPVTDYYNQQFIFKTMTRNARLQLLLKNIVLSQKEQQEGAWNQFINDLKYKHAYTSRDYAMRTNTQKQEDYPEVYDWYNTKYRWNQSRPCQNLLEDFYGTPQTFTQLPENGPVFGRGHYCYPTSSQGRLIMMNRDRISNFDRLRRLPRRYLCGNTIVIDKCLSTTGLQKPWHVKLKMNKSTTVPDFISKDDIRKSASIQTNLVVPYNIDDHNDVIIRATKQEIARNSIIDVNENDKDQISLKHIENKLEELFGVINKLMAEMNTRNVTYNNRSTSVSHRLSNNVSRSDEFAITNTESLIRGISSYTDVGTSKAFQSNFGSTRLDRILSEEIDKSNKIKKDIDDILNGGSRPSSLINDIPTKDMSTEIVDRTSRSTRKNKKSLATAMNTDPVGLLGLLKISKETITQILSYMPRIDYNSYLSMVQFPQLSKSGESDYICNICGAAFRRPSHLNGHIQKHNLDNTRNCCVCRHIVDTRRRSELFSCRYCHQQFTRAYCCELHQRSCAKNFGLKQESNLVMLT